MKYRVTVALNCTYIVEADDPDAAEAMAVLMTPDEANDMEILGTEVMPEPH